MKKLLLSMAAVALTVSASWASETTLVFDGENDMAGLTRQTTTTPADVVNEITYSQDGVDFKLEVTDGTGKGYALVNAGGTNAGIYVSSSVGSQVTLTVPNGHVTGAKLLMSGYALTALEVTFNGKEIEGNSEGGLYAWTWSDAEGGETLTMSWPSTFMARYIHSIEVTYTADLGGKEACGLKFSQASAEGFVGETFKAPTLSNPNKLPVTWSSSNESVATVDENGAVTLVGKGTTYIIASTEGNDSYAAGNARYELTVYPVANSIAEMYELAPATGNQVKVGCNLTVYYVSGASLYVMDEDGNAALITDACIDSDKASVYKKADIISEGWIATNAAQSGFKGTLADPTEAAYYIEYQEVSSIDYKTMANRVVVLSDVTFTTSTPFGTTKAFGTTPDGTSYEFQDTFNVGEKPAGTYDVTLVVKNDVVNGKEYAWLAPISYFSYPEVPTSIELTADSETVKIESSEEEGMWWVFQVDGTTTEEEVTLTFKVPEGFTGFVGGFMEGGAAELADKAQKAPTEKYDWMPLDWMFEEGMVKGNVFKLPANGEPYMGSFVLYKDDKAYNGIYIVVNYNVAKTTDAEPVVPENFTIAASSEKTTIGTVEELFPDFAPLFEDREDDFAYIFAVKGTTSEDAETITVEVPEGWDGYVYGIMPMSEIMPGSARKAKSVELIPLSEYDPDGEMQKGNKIEIPADGDVYMGSLYLYKGDMVAANDPVSFLAQIEKDETVVNPTFPEEFGLDIDNENVTASQFTEDGEHYIILEGETTASTVTVTVAVPEGWDGFYSAVWGEEEGGEGDGPTPFAGKRAKAASEDGEEMEYMWVPVEELMEEMPLKDSNCVTLKTGDPMSAAIMFLYKDDQALYLPIYVNSDVAKIQNGDEPVFPESFVVTTNPADLEVSQMPAEDWGDGMVWPYTINIDGKSSEATATITIEVPEGWTNFIGISTDLTPYSGKQKAKSTWESKGDLIAEGYVEGNVIEVAVDGTGHTYQYYLCNGDQVDTEDAIEINVSIRRVFPDLAYPEKFDITLNSEGPKIEQNIQPDDIWSDATITITGECDTETLIVTLAVPEGWDGFVGATDADMDDSGAELLNTRASGEDLFFYPLSSLEYNEPPLKEGNEFKFAADGDTHYGMAYLYKENMYCLKMISFEVTVNDINSGINGIEAADPDARYFNLQGVEVKNTESGIYVKVSNGKISKVNVK